MNPAGLGYLGERSTCEASPTFVFGVDDANDVARCVENRHRCQAAQLVSQENPRARELLQLAGVNASDVSGCLLSPGANGRRPGVGDPVRAKVLVKCAQGIQKAAAKFAQARLGGFQKCLAAVTKCIQQKPGDAGCLAGARGKCLGDGRQDRRRAERRGWQGARGDPEGVSPASTPTCSRPTGSVRRRVATYCAASA